MVLSKILLLHAWSTWLKGVKIKLFLMILIKKMWARETWRKGGKLFNTPALVRAYVITDEVCAQMLHFQVYNERAFNEFFATLHGVTLILSLPHKKIVYICVCHYLLNIILTPHLFWTILWRWWTLGNRLRACCCDFFYINLCIVIFFGAKLIFFTAIA